MIDIGQAGRQMKTHHFLAPSFDNPTPDPSADPPVVAGQPILQSEYSGAQGFGAGTFSISNSGSHTLTVTLVTGTGPFRVGWPIIVYGGFAPGSNYVLARVTGVSDITSTTNVVSFSVYDSNGSGSFATWYVDVGFVSLNYTQNENYSAYDTPVRSWPNGGDISISFPTNLSSTSYVTEDTPAHKSGYTEVNYKMTVRVTESEWETHRPYVGKTLNAKNTLTTTVVTWSYPDEEPTVTTTSVDVAQVYSFTEADFDIEATGYSEGEPAIYNEDTGAITQYPSPSICTQDNIPAEDGTYKSYEYSDSYSQFEPDGPYILSSYVRTYRSWGSVFYEEPSPTDFFWPG